MVGTVGRPHAGAQRVPVGPSTASMPRQRMAPSRTDLPVQPSSVASPAPALILVADPIRDTRDRLASGLASDGLANVIKADTVDVVAGLIAGSSGGQLALVSLLFGQAAPRLIEGLCRVPWTRVIALAPSAEPRPVLDAVAAGATGVLRGHPGGPDIDLPAQSVRLTPREVAVLQLVADGRTNKWIAEHLSLSALTVKSHLSRISRKLGTGDRSHQVAVAMRAGILR